MVFSSPFFLFFFLPILLGFYFLADKSYKNTVLLVASLVFYAWGELKFVPLILGSILFNWFIALCISKAKTNSGKKAFIIYAVIVNIGSIILFKYVGFLIGLLNTLLGTHLITPAITLPLGISFFTFHALSYVIDVYRGTVEANKRLSSIALYLLLFPQLIAGPIVRYNSIQEQLQNRIHSWDQFSGGATRFIRGLAQKVLIADLAGKVAQSVFSTPTHELSLAAAWTGIIFYTIQIYFDFSGYSSMAIGLAKMFGFDFQENFNFPYISKSITEFWTRWHISLSTWFKNYVYIPLGGNRKGLLRTMMNQWIVFVLCGLWHGASASFLIWGIYYGTLISLEKIPFISNIQKKLPVIAQHLLTLLLIIIGWVLFVSDQVTGKEYIMTLFGFGRGAWTYSITILDWGVIILGIFFSTPIFIKTLDSIKNANRRNLLVILLSIFIFILACVVMISSIYHPFLYFRF